jgi:hypothetical protein
MNRDEWEERLQNGPYVDRIGPKRNQINTIQDKVLRADQGRRAYTGLGWIVPVTLCLAIIVGVFILNNPFQQHQEKSAASLTDRDLLTIMDQENPDPRREMLYRENIGDKGILIFTKKLSAEQTGMTWEAGYINSTSRGWNWVGGGETWIDYVTNTEYDQGLREGFKRGLISVYISFKEGAPFPLMYGTIIDPRITQVRITDDNNLQQMAKVVRYAHRNYYTLWFALLPDRKDATLKVEGMDTKGTVIETHQAHIDNNGLLMN